MEAGRKECPGQNRLISVSRPALTYKVGGPADCLVPPRVNLCLSEAEEGPGESLDNTGLVPASFSLGETAAVWGEAGSARRQK